jgi:hypothetical protein
MTRLYTVKQRQEILKTLAIKPNKDGRITGKEAATILTWRAKEEADIEHDYSPSILRRHVEQGNLTAYPGTKITKDGKSRKSFYDVEAVFDLSIEPRRGLVRKRENKADAA